MTDCSRPASFDTLLELLTKIPDAATVEVLLTPQHLERLLRAHGWTDAEIRRDLTAGGRAPGELLLDVLAKQPDSAKLMEMLGHPKPVAARPTRPQPSLSAPRAVAARPTRPQPSLSAPRAVAALAFGVLLAGWCGWFVFVRLDVLRFPRLIVAFPRAYVLLFSGLVLGLMSCWKGMQALRERARPG